jgi:hypothetical protein
MAGGVFHSCGNTLAGWVTPLVIHLQDFVLHVVEHVDRTSACAFKAVHDCNEDIGLHDLAHSSGYPVIHSFVFRALERRCSMHRDADLAPQHGARQ